MPSAAATGSVKAADAKLPLFSEELQKVHAYWPPSFVFLDLHIDAEKNFAAHPDQDIATVTSKVRMLVIQGPEELSYCPGMLEASAAIR